MADAPALALHLVVFLAATLQTVTGIGFALIAGPFLLVFMRDGSAVQISILLNLALSAVLAPTLVRHVDWPSFRRLTLGLLFGLPSGIALFILADLAVLKLGAALFVLLALVPFVRPSPRQRLGNTAKVGAAAGVAAGVMTGFAAMPGPAASYYLSGLLDLPRDVARSTIYAFFIVAYGAALALHWSITGLSDNTIAASLWLVPAAAAGMLAGIPLVRTMPQKYFRAAVALALGATALALLITTLSD